MKRACLIVAIVFAIASACMSNPYDIFGNGARANGLSWAYTALAEDASACFYNPAGLAQLERLQIELGYFYAEPHMFINGRDVGVDKNKGTYIGFVASTKIFGHRLTAGADVFLPDQHVMRFLMLPSTKPQFVMYLNNNHVVAALVCGGLELFKWLYIGGGASFMGDNYGGVNFTISEREPSTGSLESDIGSMFKPIFGILAKPFRVVKVGFTYREKTEVDLKLPNVINIPELVIFDENSISIISPSKLTLLATSYSHFSPTQFDFGISWRPITPLLLSLDLNYALYSEFHNPSPYTYVKLEGGLEELFPVNVMPYPPDPKFKDILIPSIGIEFQPLSRKHVDLDIRTGYAYRPTPVTNYSTGLNFVDANAHILSAGLGLTFKSFLKILPRPLSLDFFYQHQILENREIERPVWDPIGSFEISGYVPHAGAVLITRF